MVVAPANDKGDKLLPGGEAHRKECGGAKDGHAHLRQTDRPAGGDTRDHGDNNPADRIVEHRGPKDDLTDRAAREVQFTDHRGDNLHGRDRQCGAQKQRGRQAPGRIGQQRVGQNLSKEKSTGEGDDDARQRDGERGPARVFDEPKVDLHPGQQQQHHDPEL